MYFGNRQQLALHQREEVPRTPRLSEGKETRKRGKSKSLEEGCEHASKRANNERKNQRRLASHTAGGGSACESDRGS